MGVQIGEVVLGACLALVGGLAKPFRGFRGVFRHALSLGVRGRRGRIARRPGPCSAARWNHFAASDIGLRQPAAVGSTSRRRCIRRRDFPASASGTKNLQRRRVVASGVGERSRPRSVRRTRCRRAAPQGHAPRRTCADDCAPKATPPCPVRTAGGVALETRSGQATVGCRHPAIMHPTSRDCPRTAIAVARRTAPAGAGDTLCTGMHRTCPTVAAKMYVGRRGPRGRDFLAEQGPVALSL